MVVAADAGAMAAAVSNATTAMPSLATNPLAGLARKCSERGCFGGQFIRHVNRTKR